MKISSKKIQENMNKKSSFTAFTFLAIFLTTPFTANAGGSIIPNQCFTQPGGCGWNDLIQLGQNIMGFMIFLIPIAATIAFVWAGWLYMSSQGDQGKVKQAHKIFGTVTLGIFLTLGAWLLINTILTFLGVDSSYTLLG
jgi:heme/copper-type cytochrome/quinol oxidase subunit 2